LLRYLNIMLADSAVAVEKLPVFLRPSSQERLRTTGTEGTAADRFRDSDPKNDSATDNAQGVPTRRTVARPVMDDS
jgi:hypothetical protein